MECKKCGSKYVSNKWFKLCHECNNERVHGSKYGKQVDYKEKEIKSLKSSNKESSKKRVIDKGQKIIVSGGNKKSKSFQNIYQMKYFILNVFKTLTINVRNVALSFQKSLEQ